MALNQHVLNGEEHSVLINRNAGNLVIAKYFFTAGAFVAD